MFTDYSSELKQFKTNAALTQFYSLPDGQTVDISSEMISTAEPLFNPETLLGADDTVASQLPMHKLVNNAFRRLDSVFFSFSYYVICYVTMFIAELWHPKGSPSGAPYSYRKEKETHELIFLWLSRLARGRVRTTTEPRNMPYLT